MKKIIILTGLIAEIIFFVSCKKDNMKGTNPPGSAPPGSSASFFANTEWTGVAATYGQAYQQPCYLHFNGDTTVSVYAPFIWVIGSSLESIDSVVGKITAIDGANTATTTITVNFPFSNDQQTYTITDMKTLKGGSQTNTMATNYTRFTMQMDLCPAVIPDISLSNWGSDVITAVGPTQGLHEFPDIDGVSFNADGTTSYVRGGKIVTYTPPDQTQRILLHYTQVGPKIYFGGYNEVLDQLVGYFGVMTADGKTILADSHSTGCRIPYSYQTIYWYGPPGVTPNIHKLN